MKNYRSKLETLIFLSTVFFGLFLFAKASQAATYHVATDGNDSDPGTLSQPFRTITKGVSALASGDTLLIRAGTYVDQPLEKIPSGTAGAPTLIKNYQNESVTLATSNSLNGGGLGSFCGQSYITIDGLKFDATNATDFYGEVVWVGGNANNNCAGPDGLGSHHLIFTNFEMFGILGHSNSNGFMLQKNTYDNLFQNCKIHDLGWLQNTAGSYPIYNVGQRTIVDHCQFYNVGCSAIKYGEDTSDGGEIQYNIIHDFGSALDPGHAGSPAIDFSVKSMNIKVYNNILYNNLWNDSLSPGGFTADYINLFRTSGPIYIYNNTIYNANNRVVRGITRGGQYTLSDTYIKNNIIYMGPGLEALYVDSSYGPPTLPTYSNNLCDKAGDGCATVGDPKFVNPAAGDFHLQSTSPAINAGVTLPEVPDDLDGNRRPQGAA